MDRRRSSLRPDALTASSQRPRGAALEVFLAFLRLGLTSFGGPVAHLGYFRAEFVERRRWLADGDYADLVALCQFLPGPASSQVGMALGLGRAGWAGALCAWLGFTMPSALALIVFAMGVDRWAGWARSGAVHGLQVVAVAIVAQAVQGMARTLCTDRTRAGIAFGAALLVLALPSTVGQLGAIVAGGLAGRWAVAAPASPAAVRPHAMPVRPATGIALLLVFAVLLVVPPIVATALGSAPLAVLASFYRAGALVFGGGHVVLPLLEASVVPGGLVSRDAFLAGYGAAQAVPGPLFTFAAYLGAVMKGPLGGWGGGLAALVALFLPAFLLVAGALPFRDRLRRNDAARRSMAGVNAAVVGVLGAALYDPVWTSAILSRGDAALALAAYGLLVVGRRSPVEVVVCAAAAGALLGP